MTHHHRILAPKQPLAAPDSAGEWEWTPRSIRDAMLYGGDSIPATVLVTETSGAGRLCRELHMGGSIHCGLSPWSGQWRKITAMLAFFALAAFTQAAERVILVQTDTGKPSTTGIDALLAAGWTVKHQSIAMTGTGWITMLFTLESPEGRPEPKADPDPFTSAKRAKRESIQRQPVETPKP